MHKERWIFYMDLFVGMRCERIDADGLTIADATTSFSDIAETMAGAPGFGYVAGDHAAACELRRGTVPAAASVSGPETVDAQRRSSREDQPRLEATSDEYD